MNQSSTPAIGPDFATRVRDRVPMPFEHDLVDHPLLQLDAIADLAEELGPDHISAQEAVKPLVASSTSFRDVAAGGIAASIRELAVNDSWFTLLNIERSPAYRALVDEVLDAVAAAGGMDPRLLERRMGFVFASSPGAVTSAHFDVENSLLFQLTGHRTLTFGDWASPDQRDHEVHRYWGESSFGRIVQMPRERAQHALEPGVGCYIPPYVPHWITNEDAPSLSLTLTFYESSTEREALVGAFNARARKLGLSRTRRYGEAPLRDRGKAGLMRAGNRIKRLGERGETVGAR